MILGFLVVVTAVLSPGFWMIVLGLAGNFLLILGQYETLPTWATIVAWICLGLAYSTNVVAFWVSLQDEAIGWVGFGFGMGFLTLAASLLIVAFFSINPALWRASSAVVLLVTTMVSSMFADLWADDIL